jgi:predicted TIM-barrel fold metal-dependent hydrolase
MTALAIPPELEHLAGRIVDVDTHEMMPTKAWKAEFGEIIQELVESYENSHYARATNPTSQYMPDFERDDGEINADTVWHLKGPHAPSTTDLRRRIEVMDLTGVSRELVFPSSAGLWAAILRTGMRPLVSRHDVDVVEYSKALFEAHNEWAIRTQQISPRLRPVGIVQGEDPAEVVTIARNLIERGIRAFQFLSSELLGGRSPAHPDLDPLWELMASHRVVGTLHVGSEGGFLKTAAWGDADVFQQYKDALELHMSPWHMSILHLPAQNFLATMITGGVFDRHPGLAMGAIETTAHWVGPLAQQLDMWYENGYITQRGAKNPFLSERPSEYLRRNVRVSAFDFEPVDEYIRRFGLEEVYCYSSDFPHLEGGVAPMQRFLERLAPLGADVIERFFVRNGELLLPE